jgi:hypothetical protein
LPRTGRFLRNLPVTILVVALCLTALAVLALVAGAVFSRRHAPANRLRELAELLVDLVRGR